MIIILRSSGPGYYFGGTLVQVDEMIIFGRNQMLWFLYSCVSISQLMNTITTLVVGEFYTVGEVLLLTIKNVVYGFIMLLVELSKVVIATASCGPESV